ncbi:hypothetical protein D3C75_1234450 [compost metagenome]
MYLMTTAAFFLSAYLFPDGGMAPQDVNKLLTVCAISASGFPVTIILLQKKLAKRTLNFCHMESDS